MVDNQGVTEFGDMKIEELVGKILVSVKINNHDDQVEFIDSMGVKYIMYHSQD